MDVPRTTSHESYLQPGEPSAGNAPFAARQPYEQTPKPVPAELAAPPGSVPERLPPPTGVTVARGSAAKAPATNTPGGLTLRLQHRVQASETASPAQAPSFSFSPASANLVRDSNSDRLPRQDPEVGVDPEEWGVLKQWTDMVYTHRFHHPDYTSPWYLFKGTYFYSLESLASDPVFEGEIGGLDVDGARMKPDAVAYVGAGRFKRLNFCVFKGNRFYRYNYLEEDHDGCPGILGGGLRDVDSAAYARGTGMGCNWVVVKDGRYYTFRELSDDPTGPLEGTPMYEGFTGLDAIAETGHMEMMDGEYAPWYVLKGQALYCLRMPSSKAFHKGLIARAPSPREGRSPQSHQRSADPVEKRASAEEADVGRAPQPSSLARSDAVQQKPSFAQDTEKLSGAPSKERHASETSAGFVTPSTSKDEEAFGHVGSDVGAVPTAEAEPRVGASLPGESAPLLRHKRSMTDSEMPWESKPKSSSCPCCSIQ
mmetsp:Transcript_14038/g.51028  ORF Transcript_14038/g.51028 Transcript_14038/m.51028 type:complete len:482 (+) Transcript_14038:188-1633(+)